MEIPPKKKAKTHRKVASRRASINFVTQYVHLMYFWRNKKEINLMTQCKFRMASLMDIYEWIC